MDRANSQTDLLEPSFDLSNGGVMTDLDGTLVEEENGRFFISDEVRNGLASLYKVNCPVIINTLRFPLSIMETFKDDLLRLSEKPVPVITLNGSQAGYITKQGNDTSSFEETHSFPLIKEEIEHFVNYVDRLFSSKTEDVFAFYYPRDWHTGEVIWTPYKEKISEIRGRYKSASRVYSTDIETLKADLESEDISMIFLKADRMDKAAFQRTYHKDFYTTEGTDKLYGAKQFVSHMGLKLENFIGAGDSPMDVFLKGTGQVIKVGNQELNFSYKTPPLELDNVTLIGEAFTEIAETYSRSNGVYKI